MDFKKCIFSLFLKDTVSSPIVGLISLISAITSSSNGLTSHKQHIDNKDRFYLELES